MITYEDTLFRNTLFNTLALNFQGTDDSWWLAAPEWRSCFAGLLNGFLLIEVFQREFKDAHHIFEHDLFNDASWLCSSNNDIRDALYPAFGYLIVFVLDAMDETDIEDELRNWEKDRLQGLVNLFDVDSVDITDIDRTGVVFYDEIDAHLYFNIHLAGADYLSACLKDTQISDIIAFENTLQATDIDRQLRNALDSNLYVHLWAPLRTALGI